MIGLNIQTSFLTPPFGFALFYLRGVASKAVKTIEMYKGVVPFIALQLVGLAIVGFNPSLVNYLPTMTFLSSETAPLQKIHVYNSAWKIIYLIFMKKSNRLYGSSFESKSVRLLFVTQKTPKL